METTERVPKNGDSTAGDRRTDLPSVGSSLEHLVAASQGVITKRIDLALLEGRELLSRTVRSAALVGLGIVLAAAAWFALAASGVLFALPEESSVVHLAAFALLNGGCALGLIALALRKRAATNAGAHERQRILQQGLNRQRREEQTWK